jgi:transcriptional regulator with XRE-family HTH domain
MQKAVDRFALVANTAFIMPKTRRPHATLQAWMEATGTTTQQLAALARIDNSHMSRILTRSRRCSLEKAWRLHEVTGVPVENLVRWLKHEPGAKIEQSFKSGTQKVA